MTITAWHHIILGYGILVSWPALLKAGIMRVVPRRPAWFFLAAAWSQLFIGTKFKDFPYTGPVAFLIPGIGLVLLVLDIHLSNKSSDELTGGG